MQYWTVHPERAPECIFVPFYEAADPVGDAQPASGMLSRIEEAFDPLCVYTLKEGQSGYILYVSQWKTVDAAQE